RRWTRHCGLRDAEGPRGCLHARAPGVDSNPRERPGHDPACCPVAAGAGGAFELSRVPAPSPRHVHLGTDVATGRAPRRDRRVPAGGRRPDGIEGVTIMAIVKIPSENVTLSEPDEVAPFLARFGIEYERWNLDRPVSADAPPDEVLA